IRLQTLGCDDIICRSLGEAIMARPRIELQPDEAEELRRRARASTVSVRDRRRSELVLLSAEGLTQQQIADRLGISRLQVNRWVGRFASDRLAGLRDAPGRGRKPWLADGAAQQVLERAVTPPPDLGRWSCRTMARAVGISAASVQRLWAANDIKPHLSRTFKLSNDKRFEQKFWDVIGLYLDPPEKALVLCCVRNHNARRWNAPSRVCRWGSDTFAPRPVITCDTAR